MNLTRITINREDNSVALIETGDVHYRDLTDKEKKELKTLEEQLENFSDFSTAEKLRDDQHKAVMAKKKRYEELQQLPNTPQIEWKVAVPQPTGIILIQRGGELTYLEGVPEFIFEKLFSQDINITITGAAAPVQPSGAPIQAPAPAGNRLYEKLDTLNLSAPWRELLDVEYVNGLWFVKPKKYLKDDYNPIKDAMNDLNASWVSKGKGDKNAHWELKL